MELETRRLLLREFTWEDVDEMLHYQQQPLYLRFCPWHERSEAEVKAFLGQFVAWQEQEPRHRFQLALTLREAERPVLIGNVGLRQQSPGAIEADLGYELAPDYWGQGYALEAAQAMMVFGFERLRLHRIWANCLPENVASQRVLGRLGFKLEGRLRQNQCFKGRYWDTLIYGILEDQYRQMGAST